MQAINIFLYLSAVHNPTSLAQFTLTKEVHSYTIFLYSAFILAYKTNLITKNILSNKPVMGRNKDTAASLNPSSLLPNKS